ncbi:MAG: hypothetical protein K0R02_464 [Rickettsiaceae bacterium]|jgi:nicotinic acid mononucleotide adenylyltransferase|nr:hypothetical protein [Rickettsiaceae bacterium]
MRLLLIFIILYPLSANALILENLIKDEILESTLANKKLCYYVGSFDPLHKEHEAITVLPIKKGLCDFTLIYPSWGGDSFKVRADIKLRLDMLEAVFAKNPYVLITRLPPQEMQKLFIFNNQNNGMVKVKSVFSGLEFIGVIGSDTALALNNNKSALASFMVASAIPDQYKEHTLGGLMALPVEKFIIVLRGDDNLSLLKGNLGKRVIIKTIRNKKYEQLLSSTLVKKAIKNGEGIDGMVSQSVKEIIDLNGLYKSK